jgi:AcrR family transcriptional regulator
MREAREAFYRKHILEGAERMFAANGYDAAKMQDVATESGISLGTLYAAFESKEELYRAILVARDKEMMTRVDAVVADMPSGPQGLQDILRPMQAQLKFFMEHPNYLQMVLLQGYAWYASASRPSKEEEAIWNRGFTLLRATFDWGAKAGYFVSGDSAGFARIMMALQQTRLANWVIDKMRESHDSVIGTCLAEFVRLFCKPSVAASMLDEDGTRIRPGVL